MIESLSHEEEKKKNIGIPYRLKEELNYTPIKDVRNLFRLEKEPKAIKDWILGTLLSMEKKKLIINQ